MWRLVGGAWEAGNLGRDAQLLHHNGLHVLKVVHLKRLHCRLAGAKVSERVERVERLGDGTKSRAMRRGSRLGSESGGHGNASNG